MTHTIRLLTSLLVFAPLLAGCAALSPFAERPEVNITSVRIAEDNRFVIGVQVVNPNRARLPLRGMSYSVEIEGNRILSGVAAELPEVPAYGTAEFTLEAKPDLLGSARLLADLMSRERTSIRYTFRARLDVGGMMRRLNIVESGRIGS